MTLDINDKAPEFTSATDGDGTVSLSDYKGKTVVLYFYPKDDTSGCTAESIDFKEHYKEFTDQGVIILGLSKDPVKKHDKFKEKYELPFTLISDEECKVCSDYGVWVEKSMYGRKYMGIERSTFLIDGNGSIRKIWRKVKVKDHVKEVLSLVKNEN